MVTLNPCLAPLARFLPQTVTLVPRAGPAWSSDLGADSGSLLSRPHPSPEPRGKQLPRSPGKHHDGCAFTASSEGASGHCPGEGREPPGSNWVSMVPAASLGRRGQQEREQARSEPPEAGSEVDPRGEVT